MKQYSTDSFFSIALLLLLTALASAETWIGYNNLLPRTPGIQGPITKEFIKKFLPNNPVVVEAGAYRGEDTIEMASQWEGSTIHTFEPIPSLYANVVYRVAPYANVYTYPLALSNKTGHEKFYLSEGYSDGSSSLLAPTGHLDYHPAVKFDKSITVKTITLDDWAQLNSVSKVDFLWLDLQGSELDVLKASPKVLKTVKVIFTEVSLVELYKKSGLYTDIKHFLENEGFKVIKEDLPYTDAGNVLFVRL